MVILLLLLCITRITGKSAPDSHALFIVIPQPTAQATVYQTLHYEIYILPLKTSLYWSKCSKFVLTPCC